jgi:DNA-binding protein HU-beta
MTKENIVEAVLKNAKLETKKQAQAALEAVFAAITKSLARGEEVTVTGFGTFRAVKISARSGRNPKTGEQIRIPASVKPKFRAGKALKDAVR